MKPSKIPEISPQRRPLSLLTAALAALGLVSTAQAQIQTAGELFVNVDATTQPEGLLTSITNSGTLGGFFEAIGGGNTVPDVATHSSTNGIRFDGNDFMKLVDGIGGAVILPPAGLVGADPTRTIEVWAMNPGITQEETMVSWGKRGGPDGSNMSFNYGNDARWGAVGVWGGGDMGWKDVVDAPVFRQWHHLVYTYDGTTTRVYSDGVLSNSETLGSGVINTHPDTSINLGSQLNGDGINPEQYGSLTIARVRIHDGVLSDAQILSNYDFEKDDFPNPTGVVAEPLSAPPANRYSFSEPSTNNAMDSMFLDSIGTAHGMVLGEGATFSGTRLVLPGGPPATSAYGDLPNGLVSSRSVNNGGSGEITIEGWVRVTASINWSRILDFGSAREGEVFGPGGVGSAGYDFLFYSAQIGGDTATHRVELTDNDPNEFGGRFVDVPSPGTFGNDLHFVVTWNEATRELRVFENGVEQFGFTATMTMSELNDVNVWLGRSNFTFDNNASAEYDELRIYDRVLSPGEVMGNYQAGANTLNTGDQPVTLVDEPDSITVFETYEARFAASTAGSPPISYQWRRNGSPIENATNAAYTFPAAVADSGAAFSVVVSNFTGAANVVTSSNAVLTVVTQAVELRHRYSFDETAGTEAQDSIGSAHGELRNGSSFNGAGQLLLDGVNGYVNLPNDLVTSFSNITFEAWVTDNGSGTWSRIFDFGNSSGGEDFEIGAGGAGLQHIYITHPSAPGPVRFTISIDGNAGDQHVVGVPLPVSEIKHVVLSLNAPMRTGRLFIDGVQVGENTGISLTPAAVGSTVNNWLGRAQYGNDPFFNGVYDEFRIWDGAMTPTQALASFASGPNFGEAPVSLEVVLSSPNQITISWPESASGFALEQATALETPTVWSPAGGTQTTNSGVVQVTLPVGAGNQFFRLTKPE